MVNYISKPRASLSLIYMEISGTEAKNPEYRGFLVRSQPEKSIIGSLYGFRKKAVIMGGGIGFGKANLRGNFSGGNFFELAYDSTTGKHRLQNGRLTEVKWVVIDEKSPLRNTKPPKDFQARPYLIELYNGDALDMDKPEPFCPKLHMKGFLLRDRKTKSIIGNMCNEGKIVTVGNGRMDKDRFEICGYNDDDQMPFSYSFEKMENLWSGEYRFGPLAHKACAKTYPLELLRPPPP
jgi:hypothetical protein